MALVSKTRTKDIMRYIFRSSSLSLANLGSSFCTSLASWSRYCWYLISKVAAVFKASAPKFMSEKSIPGFFRLGESGTGPDSPPLNQALSDLIRVRCVLAPREILTVRVSRKPPGAMRDLHGVLQARRLGSAYIDSARLRCRAGRQLYMRRFLLPEAPPRAQGPPAPARTKKRGRVEWRHFGAGKRHERQ